MFDIDNYKGVYFGNDTNEQQFYEGGAHFKYKDLCDILEKILLTIPLERREMSEEPQRKSNLEIIESNDNNNKSRNNKTIKPLIESLTQKFTDFNKDKENENINIEIFTFGEDRSETNNNNNNNININKKNLNNQSRNFKQKSHVPNNSKIHAKNQSNNSSNNIKNKSKMYIDENINKNSIDFRKSFLQKMSKINGYKKKNYLNNKILNISHGKYNNSRNNNSNIFDLLKYGNTSKDLLNKTTNLQKMIPLYTETNQYNQSNSLNRSKNSKSKEVNQMIKNYNYNPNSSSIHEKTLSSNKPKTFSTLNKKMKGNLIINTRNNISKRHLLFNLLKKNNNHTKTLSINDKSSKSNIDTMSYNNVNSNNNNYTEISLLSDLNSSHSKKKISNIIQNNIISQDHTNNAVTNNNINNNIILKPKINISFVNNINTIPTQKLNKSRNKHLEHGNTNTLNKLNTSFKKSLLNEIYKTTNLINKKSSNTPIRNKLVKNINLSKSKIMKTSVNKLSRNITSEKGMKNSINLTEHYMNLKKSINNNHFKIQSSNKLKKNKFQKMSFDVGKIVFHNPSYNNKSVNKNQIKSHNKSYFK